MNAAFVQRDRQVALEARTAVFALRPWRQAPLGANGFRPGDRQARSVRSIPTAAGPTAAHEKPTAATGIPFAHPLAEAKRAMLVYETYCWFNRVRQGMAERERRRACTLLLTVFVLVYLHSDEAAPFQTAMARLAAAVLDRPMDAAPWLR